jgi:hypothetical protein
MIDDSEPRTPITVAQAWSAPIVFCVVGTGLAIWGIARWPEASDVIAALVIMIVGPAAATALIARGIVGVYYRHRWRGSLAIVAGILLFTAIVMGINAVPWRGDATDW